MQYACCMLPNLGGAQEPCIMRSSTVSVVLHSNRRLYTQSQIEDYVLQREELENYSFFSFIVNTYKEQILKGRGHLHNNEQETPQGIVSAYCG